jgi:prepilin-type N-terminal cleavage/methylation domain-containing protein
MMEKKESKMLEAAKRGFTLVELLIVVAILGILGAVAVQNVTGNIEKARETAAKTGVNNIKGAISTWMISKKSPRPRAISKCL